VDEAILLADRVLVMADGQIVSERRVDIPHPRQRQHAGFAELRSDLLGCLGVSEVDAESSTLESAPTSIWVTSSLDETKNTTDITNKPIKEHIA
jgi:sulfonate transport system ATP-binding protein